MITGGLAVNFVLTGSIAFDSTSDRTFVEYSTPGCTVRIFRPSSLREAIMKDRRYVLFLLNALIVCGATLVPTNAKEAVNRAPQVQPTSTPGALPKAQADNFTRDGIALVESGTYSFMIL